MNWYEDDNEWREANGEGDRYLDVESKYRFEYRPLFIIRRALYNIFSWFVGILLFGLYTFIFLVFAQVGMVVGMLGILNLIFGYNARFVDLFRLISL